MMVHLVMVHTVVLRMMQIVIIMMQRQMMIHAVRKVTMHIAYLSVIRCIIVL